MYFYQLEKEVEELTAADECRHNLEHFSKYISVADLIEQTARKGTDETAIPSETTVLFAFVPRNMHV